MRFSVTADLSYAVLQRSTIILNVHALQTASQQIIEEEFRVEPKVRCEEFLSVTGENRFVQLETGVAKELKIAYTATVETNPRTVAKHDIENVAIAQLDRRVIPYLFPSRYCQSDRLGRLAWNKFGEIEQPYEKVAAIEAWIHKNVEYLRGETNSATSAFDTVTQRAGVCRDFAHLGIALCRALSIPARYFSGYAHLLEPPDFHACFEAYIGNEWFIFDPTQLAPRNGLVRIATGRDAADASFASIFGALRCDKVAVSCEPVGGTFTPWTSEELVGQGVTLEGPAGVGMA